MAAVDSFLVNTILSRLYTRTSSLEAALVDLGDFGGLVRCGDSEKWRKTAGSAIVAWKNRQLYQDSVGIFKYEESYQPPNTRGNEGGTPPVLERVMRSAKQVSMDLWAISRKKQQVHVLFIL